jgi:hypothetical protein
MAKKQKQQPIPDRQAVPQSLKTPLPNIGQISLGYDPTGPKESVDILSSKDGWSEFNLADGSTIRAKAVILDVKKMVGQFNADGEPVYELQLTMVNQTRVPDKLKKKKA